MVPSNYDQLAALTVVVVVLATLFVPMQVGAQGPADTIDSGEESGIDAINQEDGNESILEQYGIDPKAASTSPEGVSIPSGLPVDEQQVGGQTVQSQSQVSSDQLPDSSLDALSDTGIVDAIETIDGANSEGTVSPALDEADGETTVVVRLDALDRKQLAASESGVDALKAHAALTQRGIESYAESREAVTVTEQFWLTNAILLEVDTDEVSLDALAARPGVEEIHPNFEVQALGATASQTSATATAGVASSSSAGVNVTGKFTYGLEQIGVPSAWNETKGAGAQVAVLDTGVDTQSHPNLTPIEGGWAEFSASGDELDTEPNDGEGHGTHVSGTVVGHQTDDGVHYGVAPEADLLHGKVLNDNGGGSFASVIAGMEWATEHEADVDVMSMSLGFAGRFSERMIEPVRNAKADGITVVISSGNSGANTSASPGNVFDSFAVGASDENRDIASFSSGDRINTSDAWGDDAPEDWPETYVVPNVAAPGVDVQSAKAGGGFEELSGTSMAAPHVAGAAALLESANDQATPKAVENALESTAEKPDGEPVQQDTRYGNGIINASAAIDQVEPEATISVETGIDDAGVDISDTGGITIRSDTGFEVTTNTNSSVSLQVPAGTHNLTAEAFGYDAATATVNITEGGSRSVDLKLDQPAVDVKTIAAPEYVESGNELQITHKVAHVEEYSVSLGGSERTTPSDSSLTVAGQSVTFGEQVDITDRDPITEVTATLGTDTDLFSKFTLEHTFDSSSNSPIALRIERTETKVHPAVVTLPDDVDPGVSEDEAYTNLQETLDFVVGGTTVELDHPTFETSADIPVTGTLKSGIAINNSVTLTAASGASPVIEVTGTNGSTSTAGITTIGAGATVDGIELQGNGANVSVFNGGSKVTLANNTFQNTTNGLLNIGGNLTVTDNRFDNQTNGALFAAGSARSVSENTFTDVENGVLVAGQLGNSVVASVDNNTITGESLEVGVAVVTGSFFGPFGVAGTIENNTIGEGDSLRSGVFVAPLAISLAVQDNTIAVGNESGASVQSTLGITALVENNTLSGGQAGIQSASSFDSVNTTLRENEISNVSDAGIDILRGGNHTIDSNEITEAGTGIKLNQTNLTRVSDNDMTGAGIAINATTNTTGEDNVITNASTGLTVTNSSRNTTFSDSRFENGSDAVRIGSNSSETTLDTVTITNADGTIAFGDVDTGTNTVTDASIASNATVTVSGSNATLAVNQSPPAPPFNDTGTFLELRETGADPILSTEVGYTANAVANIDESSLRLHSYGGTWTPVAGSTVDTNAQVVTGDVSEVGVFAPLENSEPVAEDDTGEEASDNSDDGSDENNNDESSSDESGGGGGGIGGTPLPPRGGDDDGSDSGEEPESESESATEPTAQIGLDSTTVTAGEEMTLSAAASSVEDSEIVAYDWTINGETFEGETVTTSVEDIGKHEVELTVTADNDEQDTATTTLTVESAEAGTEESAEESTEDASDSESGQSSVPGFGAIAALLGILLGLGLRRRH